MDEQLNRLYAENRNPVAFLDESYELKQDQTFYILASALVHPSEIASTRTTLSDYYGGEAIHAAPMYQRREIESLKGAIELSAKQHDGMDVIVQIPVEAGDEYGQFARRACLKFLAPMLHSEDNVSLFILDALENEQAMKNDRFTFSDMRKDGLLTREVVEYHTRPSLEPLLGLPDLLAWSYRQRITKREQSWFNPFESHARIHNL